MHKSDVRVNSLRCGGVHFHRDVYRTPDPKRKVEDFSLPVHVDTTRQILLSFEGIVPGEWTGGFREEVKMFGQGDDESALGFLSEDTAFVRADRAYQEGITEHIAEHESMKTIQVLAQRARQLFEDTEPAWDSFWRHEVFVHFSNESRKYLGYNAALDGWLMNENLMWDESKPFQAQALSKPRNDPRPDLTYAFPMQGEIAGAKGLARDEFLRALSVPNLAQLQSHGLYFSPTTGLRDWFESQSKKSLSGGDKACFPWAIIEVKQENESSDDCISQATDAAAVALEMRSRLCDKLGEASPELQPVIAFTCEGPIIKVWLAYHDVTGLFKLPIQRMVCIWCTSARLTWGIASIRHIILNMHTWASRILKPKIQACVYQLSRTLQSSIPEQSKGLGGQLAITNTTEQTLTKDVTDVDTIAKNLASSSLEDTSKQQANTTHRAESKPSDTKIFPHFEFSPSVEPVRQRGIDDQYGKKRKEEWWDRPGLNYMTRPWDCNTSHTPFAALVEDGSSGSALDCYQTITAQSSYRGYSVEELRLGDYEKGSKSRKNPVDFWTPSNPSFPSNQVQKNQ